MVKKYGTKKQKIVQLDLTDSLNSLMWIQTNIKYGFKYEGKAENKDGQVFKMNVSSDEEEG